MSRLVQRAIVALLLLSACAQGPNRVEGIVVSVDGDLTTVETFTVRTNDGELLRFIPAVDGDFQPVVPFVFVVDGVHFFLRIEEADDEGGAE